MITSSGGARKLAHVRRLAGPVGHRADVAEPLLLLELADRGLEGRVVGLGPLGERRVPRAVHPDQSRHLDLPLGSSRWMVRRLPSRSDQVSGQGAISAVPGHTQPFVRLGRRSRRIFMRVNSRCGPCGGRAPPVQLAGIKRSGGRRRSRARRTTRDARVSGHPSPWQRTRTWEPRGARTASKSMLVPGCVTLPATVTIGNGLSSRGNPGPFELGGGAAPAAGSAGGW